MSEESNNLNIEPELEARIVALVLGEASDFEVEELSRLIAERPELAAFEVQMQMAHGLFQETAAGEFDAPVGDWKLPTNKRNAVLAAIRGEATVPAAIQGINPSVEKGLSARRRWRWKLAATLSGACLAGVVGVMAWPSLFVQNSDSALVASNQSIQLGVDLTGGSNVTFALEGSTVEVPGILSYSDRAVLGEPLSSREQIHGMNEDVVLSDRAGRHYESSGRVAGFSPLRDAAAFEDGQEQDSNIALSALRDTLDAGISVTNDFDVSVAESSAEMPKRRGAAGTWMYKSEPTVALQGLDDMLSELTTPERTEVEKIQAGDGLALLDDIDESEPAGLGLPELNRSIMDQPIIEGFQGHLADSESRASGFDKSGRVSSRMKNLSTLNSKFAPAKDAIAESEAEALHRSFDSKATTEVAPIAAPVMDESQLMARNDVWFSKGLGEINGAADAGLSDDLQPDAAGTDRVERRNTVDENRFDDNGNNMPFVRPELKLPTVDVPDGGTLMLGGISAGRSPTSATGTVDLYVTPQIIIQEEEEPLSGVVVESGKLDGESEIAQGMALVDGSLSMAAVDPPKADAPKVWSFYMDIDARTAAPADSAAGERNRPDASMADDNFDAIRSLGESVVMNGANPGDGRLPAEKLIREGVDFDFNVQDAPDAPGDSVGTPGFGSRQLQFPDSGDRNGRSVAPDLNAGFAVLGEVERPVRRMTKEADTGSNTTDGSGDGLGGSRGKKESDNIVPKLALPGTQNLGRLFHSEAADGATVVGGAPVTGGTTGSVDGKRDYGGFAGGISGKSMKHFNQSADGEVANGLGSSTSDFNPGAVPNIGPFFPYSQAPLGGSESELNWDVGLGDLKFEQLKDTEHSLFRAFDSADTEVVKGGESGPVSGPVAGSRWESGFGNNVPGAATPVTPNVGQRFRFGLTDGGRVGNVPGSTGQVETQDSTIRAIQLQQQSSAEHLSLLADKLAANLSDVPAAMEEVGKPANISDAEYAGGKTAAEGVNRSSRRSVVTRDVAQAQEQSDSVQIANEPMTGARSIVKPESDQSTPSYTVDVPQVESERESGEQAQEPRQMGQKSSDVVREIDAENAKEFGVEPGRQAPALLKELMNRPKGSLAEGRGEADSWGKLPAVKSKQQAELKRKSGEQAPARIAAPAQNGREYSDLTIEFDELTKQRRYGEAELVVRKAKELRPDDSQAFLMLEKAKLQKQIDLVENLKERNADNALKAINSVDGVLAASIDDSGFPQSWSELSDQQKLKYGRADAGLTEQQGASDTLAEASLWDDSRYVRDSKTLDDLSRQFKRRSVQKSIPSAQLNEKTAATEAFSTFSLHVSDVSFKLALAALGKGEWPEAAKIRIEEFVNAFDYGDPMPCNGAKVACAMEQSIHPFVQQRNLLRVSMKTAAEGRASKTPLRLTFLLDNSGSMERMDRQQMVRRAFAMLAQQLKPIDQVTLISFARQPRLLADKVSGSDAKKLVGLIDELPSEGGTNIEAALQLAFEKANEQQTVGAQNRIILLTDGAVNLGNANPESLSEMVSTMRSSGIAFDAAGISAKGLNDEVLEALTRQGDGRYYLLDSVESADDGFARQIAGALRPSAKNVKVQVEFNPKRVGHYKLLGFEKHVLKKQDFRNDSVDAAEMAAAEAGVAMYQFEAMPDGEGDVGSVSVRFKDLSTGQMVENRWPIPYEADAVRPDQAAPSLRLAASATMLAARLKGEPLGASVDLKELSRLVSGLPEQVRSDKRVQQLQQMIDQARQLDGK